MLQNLQDEKRPHEAVVEMLSERELALWLKAPKPRVLAATKMAQLSAQCNMQHSDVSGGQRGRGDQLTVQCDMQHADVRAWL